MAQVKETIHAGVRCGFAQIAGAFNIHGLQIGTATLSLTASQVVDGPDAAHGGAQTAHITETGDGHLDRDTSGQARGMCRRPQQDTNLVTRFDQLTGQHPTNEACGSG
jgi:hypothetical protein